MRKMYEFRMNYLLEKDGGDWFSRRGYNAKKAGVIQPFIVKNIKKASI